MLLFYTNMTEVYIRNCRIQVNSPEPIKSQKLLKAKSVGTDAVIMCLEDAVTEQHKKKARTKVKAFLELNQIPTSIQFWVRINPLTSKLALKGLVAVMAGKTHGIFFPKPSSANDFETLDHYLTVLEVQNGIKAGSTKIMSVAESSVGSLNQHEFINVSDRLQGFTWCAEDLSADIGASTNRDEEGAYFLNHRMNRANCLLVAGAGYSQAVDGICANYEDEQTLRIECEHARIEGYTVKLAIYPAQVAVINECFIPSKDELAYAQRVEDAFAEVQGQALLALMVECWACRI